MHERPSCHVQIVALLETAIQEAKEASEKKAQERAAAGGARKRERPGQRRKGGCHVWCCNWDWHVVCLIGAVLFSRAGEGGQDHGNAMMIKLLWLTDMQAVMRRKARRRRKQRWRQGLRQGLLLPSQLNLKAQQWHQRRLGQGMRQPGRAR